MKNQPYNKPLFTIVTVCFNSEKTIERTIKSVLSQTLKDYEYLIIDGASSDNTVEIIKKYETLFEGRLRWLSEHDKGIYNAFNKGVRMATGQYVWLVNSDDYINPNALEVFADNIAQYGTDVVYSAGTIMVDSNGVKLREYIYTEKDSLEERMKNDSIAFVHPATIIPKEIYESIGYYDEEYKIMGDLDWSRKAWLSGVRFKFIDVFVTNMYNGGISGVPNFKKNKNDRIHYYSKFYRKPESIHRFIIWVKRFLKDYLKYSLTKNENNIDNTEGLAV